MIMMDMIMMVSVREHEKGADMNKVEFTFEGNDVLVKHVPCPQFGEGCYQSEVVIDKETFLKCMKRWVAESEEQK